MSKTALCAFAVAATLAASTAPAQPKADPRPSVTGDAVLDRCLKDLDITEVMIGARTKRASDTRQMTADMQTMMKSYAGKASEIREKVGKRTLTLGECNSLTALQKKMLLMLSSVK